MTLDNKLIVTPLNHMEFKPFGEVIEVSGNCESKIINDGYATRYHDLADVDVSSAGGRPLINIFRGRPRPLPLTIHMMEQHPHGSQAFIPLHCSPFVIVVARPGQSVRPENLVAFITSGFQGVNYSRGVWHFPLLVLGENDQDFVVVDRGGDDDNCEERYFTQGERRILDLQGYEP